MKKIIILIAILCCMSYAKCKTYSDSESVDIYCDRASHENYNIKSTYLNYFKYSDMLTITYTYNDGSHLRKSYLGFKKENFTHVTIELYDEAGVTIKEKEYDSDYIILKTIYREYRKDHNLVTYAETL